MKKSLWFCISVFAFELIISTCIYPTLPQTIPMHWNLNGVADGFGGRWTIYLIPIITAPVIFLFYGFMTYLMHKNENIRRSKGIIAIVLVLMQVIFACEFVWLILKVKGSLPEMFTIDKITFAIMGMVLMILGNYMPKIKQNAFLGIRTPWALKDPVVWQKSQRFGGMLFITAGVLFILSLLLPPYLNIILPTAYILLCGVAMYLYSYLVYKQK
jgi:uncharacterized membrane protein